MRNKSRYWLEQQLITHPDIVEYRQHSGILRGIAVLRQKRTNYPHSEVLESDAYYIFRHYID